MGIRQIVHAAVGEVVDLQYQIGIGATDAGIGYELLLGHPSVTFVAASGQATASAPGKIVVRVKNLELNEEIDQVTIVFISKAAADARKTVEASFTIS